MKVHRIQVVALAILLTLPSLALAQEGKSGGDPGKQEDTSNIPSVDLLVGKWDGYWLSPSGYFYNAELHLEIVEDNTVEGYINWTLEVSPREEEQKKIGLTGVEQVIGEFDPSSGVLVMEGVLLDDPNNIIGLDRYRLFLAWNRTVLGGITYNHGTWQGVFMVEADRG
jgi:hypothetical protein